MMRRAALLLLLLTGCSALPPEEAKEGPVSGVSHDAAQAEQADPDPAAFTASARFSVRWDRSLGARAVSTDRSSIPITHPGMVRWLTLNDFGGMGDDVLRPAVLNGAVYAANAGGLLLRLDPRNGDRVWRVSAGIVVTGGVGAGGGLILVGGEKGEVLAYDEAGKLVWKTTVTSEVLGQPQVADGIVVVRSGDGRIAGLDATDGKRKWLYEHSLPALVVRNSAGVTIKGDTIYAGYAGGKLAAIDLNNGNLRWEATLSEPRGNTELERISDITSPPQVDEDVVCAASYQGRVGCFSLKQGSLLWSKEMSSDKGLTLGGRYVYVTNASGEVFALDKMNGSSAWKCGQLAKRHTTAPAVYGKFLVVGEREGYLYAIRRADGALVARMGTDDSPLLTPPLMVGDGLLVQTHLGDLYLVTLD